MAAAEYDFTDSAAIEQGATFFRRFVWRGSAGGPPIDLTGCAARMQVRRSRTSPDVLLELTTENGGIVLGGAAGTIDLQLGATVTAGVTWHGGIYDLELISADGFVTRLLKGRVRVSQEVTR